MTEHELRRINEELREAVRARDEFLSIVAHELRNPLHALLLQVIAALEASRRTQDRQLIERMERTKLVVERYIEQATMLLDISRVNAGRLQLHRERMDLTEVVRTVVDSYAIEASFNGSSIDLDVPDALSGDWDRIAIEQIVSNLLSNAVKYGAGAPIDVTLTCERESAVLKIRDRGLGISQADQARIFDRFEQVMNDHRPGGIGIGLWLVNRLVRAHRGSISVDSEPSTGTCFTVVLPLDRP